MLVATAMMVLGLLCGIAAAQFGGLRLGGVIVVPLTAVYLLRSFGSFPVLVTSTIAAYVSLRVIAARLLVFGRPLFLLSVVIGSLVPVTIFEVFAVGVGVSGGVTEVEFVGSILPGIAAYNYHRLDAERRVLDAVWTMAVLLFLVVVGIGLVIAVGLSPLAGFLPPVLLGPQSDIAVAFGLTVSRPAVPVITSHRVVLGLVVVGTALSEGVRSRYGLRVAGVIVVPVVVVASFRNGWMLPLWLGTAALSYAGVWFVHWWTLLYGRVLLSMAVVFGLLASLALLPAVPTENGLLPFFIGILGGVTAYNVHVVPPAERMDSVLVTVGAVAAVTAIARLVAIPAGNGLVAEVTVVHLVAGALIVAPAGWVLSRHERRRPEGVEDRELAGPASYGKEG